MNRDLEQAVSRRLKKPNQRTSYIPQQLEGIRIAIYILQSNNSSREVECSITQVDVELLNRDKYRIVIQVEPVEFDNHLIVGLVDQRLIHAKDNDLTILSPWVLLIEDGDECIPFKGVIGVLKELPVQVEFKKSGIIDGTDIYPTEYQAIQAGEYWVSGRPDRRTYDIQIL